ncbi:hypothetical protein OAQ84_00975 [Bdellovibrionales bacterium]|nr:hypothetical protein [Bdellovibrionales bacterium]
MKLNRNQLSNKAIEISLSFIVLFIGMASSQTVHSLESFPEYWGFQEDEMGLIGRVEWVDSEYTSDLLTYSISPEWEGSFQRSDHAFDATVGSLGAKHFFVRRRLKVREELLEKFNFQLTYFDHSDFDTHQKHLVAEFDTFWSNHWGVALYSELFYEKRRDDIGVALLFDSGEKQRIRLFYSATDFSRNERNENSDTFSQEPISGIANLLKNRTIIRITNRFETLSIHNHHYFSIRVIRKSYKVSIGLTTNNPTKNFNIFW